MLKWLVLFVVFWWLGRLLYRAVRFLGHRPAPPDPKPPATSGSDLTRLTQQEISDADYEDIP